MEVLPSSQYGSADRSQVAGILLALVPSTQPGFGVELQRTSDLGGGAPASSAALSIAELDPVKLAGAPFLDAQPVDNALRYYRGRHITDGRDPSLNWTAWTTGHYPIQLSEKDVRLAIGDQLVYPVLRSEPMTDRNYAVSAADPVGRQPSSHLYMPSTQQIRVGTAAASSYAAKYLDAQYTLFSVRAAAALTMNNGYLTFSSSGPQTIGSALAAVPLGAQVPGGTGISVLARFASTQEMALARFRLSARYTTDPATADALIDAVVAAPASSWVGVWTEVVGFGGLPVTLGASCFSSYEAQYLITTTDPANSGMARMRFQYRMPSYEITR